MASSVKSKIFKCSLLSILLISLFSLTACITTESGGIGDKADDQKAVEYSVQLALSYIRNGNWDAAKRHLKTALEIDDSSAEVFLTMALVFQNNGEGDRAEEYYQKAIKLDPKSSRARNNYAVYLYSDRRYEEAVKQLELVVTDALYDKRPAAYVNLGRSYMQLENLVKAEDAFRRAFLMNKRNVSLRYQLAEVYFQMGDYPKSQQYYDAYRNEVKQQPAAALWLGIRLADKFDNRDALSSFSLALKNLYPTSKEYLLYKDAYGNSK